MIFVDTNVIMYAVGRPHPLKSQAREFFIDSKLSGTTLFTSAEVLQELVHAYIPVGRLETFDAALTLVAGYDVQVWPLEEGDVSLARQLHELHPSLDPRDLCHLASCHRRGIREVKTFDRAFNAVVLALRQDP